MNKQTKTIAVGAIALSMLAAVPVMAATTSQNTTAGEGTVTTGVAGPRRHFGEMPHGVAGTVTAISGNTITLTSIPFSKQVTTNTTTTNTALTPAAPVTYSVDATSAKVTKGFGKTAATIQASTIQVGDTLMVRGTVTGTNIIATAIIDGEFPSLPTRTGTPGTNSNWPAGQSSNKSSDDFFAGTITGVNGTNLTVQSFSFPRNKNGISTNAAAPTTAPTTKTVVVNATSATTVVNGKQTESLSALTVGQTIMISGSLDKTTNTMSATKINVFTKIARKLRSTTPPATATTPPIVTTNN
jgi:hypothetical protein